MQGDKNWILPKKINENRYFYSQTLYGRKFGNTTYVICPSIGPNGGNVAMNSVVHNSHISPSPALGQSQIPYIFRIRTSNILLTLL
jgi:hypothetical protein